MTDTDFPYTLTATALVEFLNKLKTVAVPAKIDQQYLRSIGFSSSNHRSFISLLKFINLLDQQGTPTGRYRRGLRGNDPGQIAGGIRNGYKALFDVYPNAESLSPEDLGKFIAANSSYGERAVSAAVKTFTTLCDFGDFRSAPITEASAPEALASHTFTTRAVGGSTESDLPEGTSSTHGSATGNVTINVNIALSVDATSDPEVYDAFFAAMAKHIRVLDGSTQS